jgi:hypothetical protein
MSRKSTKKVSKNRPSGTRKLKDLTTRTTTTVKGGTSAGTVTGGWNLVSNKVHA